MSTDTDWPFTPKILPERWLISHDCKAGEFLTDDKRNVKDAVDFGIVQVCPKCSGAISCGIRIQVFHPFEYISERQLKVFISPR